MSHHPYRPRTYRLYAYAMIMAISVAGCATTTPEYKRPDAQTPAWNIQAAEADTTIARDWWRAFGDPQLNNLMAKALTHNHNLQAAIARTAQTRADLKMAGAALLPSAAASAGYMNTAPQAMNITDMRDNGIPNYTAGLGISYELDLFGKNQAKQDAAAQRYFGSLYQKDALSLVLMGDVASHYFNILSLQERLRLAQNNLSNAYDLLDITKARFATGGSTALDITRAEGKIAETKANITSLEQQLQLQMNALATLTGQPPQSFSIEKATLNALQIPRMALLQPAELLERRPDIKAAEAHLKSGNADIGAAKAAFYPSVNISPSLLLAASPSAAALSVLGAIYAPLFTGGELEGQLDKVTAKQKENVHIYQQTILNAFKEAQNALISAQKTEQRERQLRQAANSARKSYKLAKEQYDLSVIDLRDVLDAHREMLNLQDQLTQARYQTLAARIDLFKAMGGGWQNEEEAQGENAPISAK